MEEQTELNMEYLSKTLQEMALTLGAFKAGIATTETLAGGPPSADLTYVLPEAKSAVVFAIAFDQNLIDSYFRKEDHKSMETNKVRSTTLANGIALEMAAFLEDFGFKAVPLNANFVYREKVMEFMKEQKSELHPPVSHRYLAVRSGIGHFGYSGHIITKENGSAIVLGSVVTDAELIPTEPLPEEENYCDGCKICLAACSSGYVDPLEKVTVTLGGKEFSYGKRKNFFRCGLVCGGLAGLSSSGKWSTWSPTRFDIPEKDEDFRAAMIENQQAQCGRPEAKGGFFSAGGRMEYTCSNCNLICHPDKEIRKARLKMLRKSGVVIEEPDGTRRAVSPEEAKEYLKSMPLERRKFYEDVSEE